MGIKGLPPARPMERLAIAAPTIWEKAPRVIINFFEGRLNPHAVCWVSVNRARKNLLPPPLLFVFSSSAPILFSTQKRRMSEGAAVQVNKIPLYCIIVYRKMSVRCILTSSVKDIILSPGGQKLYENSSNATFTA